MFMIYFTLVLTFNIQPGIQYSNLCLCNNMTRCSTYLYEEAALSLSCLKRLEALSQQLQAVHRATDHVGPAADRYRRVTSVASKE